MREKIIRLCNKLIDKGAKGMVADLILQINNYITDTEYHISDIEMKLTEISMGYNKLIDHNEMLQKYMLCLGISPADLTVIKPETIDFAVNNIKELGVLKFNKLHKLQLDLAEVKSLAHVMGIKHEELKTTKQVRILRNKINEQWTR